MQSRWWEHLGDAGGAGITEEGLDPEHRRRDGGFTLIEILVTLMLVGIAFVALLGGMGTAILGSDMHRKQAVSETVLASAAERLKAPDLAHVACAAKTDATYLAAVRSVPLPSGWTTGTVTISTILYSQGPDASGIAQYGSTCYDTAAYGNLLTTQLITVQVKAPDNRATESVSILKGEGW